MTQEEFLIQTDTVRARVMHLGAGEATPWHYHTEVTDTMVCLTGQIGVRRRQPAETLVLAPGERCHVDPLRVHQVADLSPADPASYLLLQGVGRYDFNVVEES